MNVPFEFVVIVNSAAGLSRYGYANVVEYNVPFAAHIDASTSILDITSSIEDAYSNLLMFVSSLLRFVSPYVMQYSSSIACLYNRNIFCLLNTSIICLFPYNLYICIKSHNINYIIYLLFCK